jgi:ankyrin repeat protein
MRDLENRFVINKIPNASSMSAKEKVVALKAQKRPFKLRKSGVLVYQSKKGDLRNLNCQVIDTDANLMTCRHLASFHAFEAPRGIKDYHETLHTEESLKATPYLFDNRFDRDRLAYRSSFYHIFSHFALGQALKQVASILNDNEETTLLIGTENHMMSVTIIRKKIGENRAHYIIKFYEPNQTNAHLRAICPTLKSIDDVSFSLFLTKKKLTAYFPKIKTAILSSNKMLKEGSPHVFITSKNRSGILYHCIERYLSNTLEELLNTYSGIKTGKLIKLLRFTSESGESLVHFALKKGYVRLPHLFLETVQQSNLSLNKQCALLSARDSAGFSILFLILFKGYHALAGDYLDQILNSKLSNPAKKELLLAYSNGGEPGLYFSLQNGEYDTVRVFTQRVINSTLNSEDKTDILMASGTKDGLPGLYMAIERQEYETVRLFTSLILNSTLSPEQKIHILIARQPIDNLPGLFVTLQNGDHQTVDSLITPLLNSSLSSEQKTAYLMAKRTHDGVPGLFMSQQKGHHHTIQVFIENVLSSSLNIQQKIELISAKNSDGISGLMIALSQGHHESVKAFIGCVLASSVLSNKEKTALLISRNNQGDEGLFYAMQNGHHESIRVFMERVIGAELSPKDKALILDTKDQSGVPGLFFALQEGDSQSVRCYTEAVLNATCLREEDKVKMLTAQRKGGMLGLSIACLKGQTKAIEVYLELIVKSSLSKDSKAYLILGKAPQARVSPLAILIKHHTDIARTLILAMKEIGVSSAEIYESLKLESPDKGCQAFIQGILPINQGLQQKRKQSLFFNEINEETDEFRPVIPLEQHRL